MAGWHAASACRAAEVVRRGCPRTTAPVLIFNARSRPRIVTERENGGRRKEKGERRRKGQRSGGVRCKRQEKEREKKERLEKKEGTKFDKKHQKNGDVSVCYAWKRDRAREKREPEKEGNEQSMQNEAGKCLSISSIFVSVSLSFLIHPLPLSLTHTLRLRFCFLLALSAWPEVQHHAR